MTEKKPWYRRLFLFCNDGVKLSMIVNVAYAAVVFGSIFLQIILGTLDIDYQFFDYLDYVGAIGLTVFLVSLLGMLIAAAGLRVCEGK